MKYSIITVCINSKAVIRSTIESVLAQTYKDYEYIIIDGASTDGTFEIISEYKRCNDCISAISEPDDGIYDAMNKGVTRSKGDYLFFLNAGDVFFNENVLSEVNSQIVSKRGDIYYGDIIKNHKVDIQSARWSVFKLVYLERMICHQSLFAHRSQFDNNLFDTTFSICADREWLIYCLIRGAILIHFSDIVISYYDSEGISSNYTRFQKESLLIGRRFGGLKALGFIMIKRGLGKLVGHKYSQVDL